MRPMIGPIFIDEAKEAVYDSVLTSSASVTRIKSLILHSVPSIRAIGLGAVVHPASDRGTYVLSQGTDSCIYLTRLPGRVCPMDLWISAGCLPRYQ